MGRENRTQGEYRYYVGDAAPSVDRATAALAMVDAERGISLFEAERTLRDAEAVAGGRLGAVCNGLLVVAVIAPGIP